MRDRPNRRRRGRRAARRARAPRPIPSRPGRPRRGRARRGSRSSRRRSRRANSVTGLRSLAVAHVRAPTRQTANVFKPSLWRWHGSRSGGSPARTSISQRSRGSKYHLWSSISSAGLRPKRNAESSSARLPAPGRDVQRARRRRVRSRVAGPGAPSPGPRGARAPRGTSVTSSDALGIVGKDIRQGHLRVAVTFGCCLEVFGDRDVDEQRAADDVELGAA